MNQSNLDLQYFRLSEKFVLEFFIVLHIQDPVSAC